MDYLDRIFLWLGKTSKNQIEFDEYFKLDYSNNPKICGFCKDIGTKWYDEDFIGYLKFDEEMSITDILEEVPISRDDINKVLIKCEELNIRRANAVYWYSGEIETPSQNKSYNELPYIGEYDLD
ncbi:immunity 22 family protein [Zobellia laminariae]|uniref:immunity 22 family protein n=1 Tax=Zobellia laminariae TaxID=248906 RepID=UPI003EF53C47